MPRSPSKKTSQRKSTSRWPSPGFNFPENKLSSLIGIAKDAGLPEAREDEFADWLTTIPDLIPGLSAMDEIVTQAKQRSHLAHGSDRLKKAVAAITTDCPQNILFHYYMRYRLRELEHCGKRRTNDDINEIGSRFRSDIADLLRWQSILAFAVERAHKDPPNSDEIAKSNQALRAGENCLLKHITKTWRDRFFCRTATSKTSHLVKFCVQLFKALGLLRGSDDHHEAMRKRLTAIAKSVGKTNARNSPRPRKRARKE